MQLIDKKMKKKSSLIDSSCKVWRFQFLVLSTLDGSRKIFIEMIFKIVRVAVISICWCNIQAQLSQILSRFIPQSDYFINDNNENQQTSPNYQQNSFNNLQPQYQSSGDFGSCSNFWSYQNDQYGSYGLVTIPNPNYNKNVLKIILSLAAQLPSVNICIKHIKLVWIYKIEISAICRRNWSVKIERRFSKWRCQWTTSSV